MARENRWSRGGWGLAVMGGLGIWLVWREIQNRLTPINPGLAARYGLHLTRAPQRVLAVTAHQDDLELFVRGTLRLLALAGSQITVVVATGGHEQYMEQRTLDQIREQEQRDAGVILGYDDIRFLRLRDLKLAHHPTFEPRLREVWDEVQPHLVLSFDPTAPYRSAVHPDHLAVGRVVLNIVRSLGSNAPDVVFYGTRDPNALVDISQVMEDKMQAIQCHRSQRYGWKRFYTPIMRWQAQLAGRSASLPYAEPLRYLSLPMLRKAATVENWSSSTPQYLPQ